MDTDIYVKNLNSKIAAEVVINYSNNLVKQRYNHLIRMVITRLCW